MRVALERHGGSVEKFIGDAVLAAFGVPTAHEDDALRAVRAALEMREQLRALNEQLGPERDLRLEMRIGIDTGEVFAGENVPAGGFVTGNALNRAKRLEQAAAAGEILLGAGTLRLVRDAVRTEPLQPLEGGKERSAVAFRLLDVVEGAAAIPRRLQGPLVGREQELASLRAAFEQAREARQARLVTLVGEPGIGKTRLARELVSALGEEATVLVGRCVSYGDGATYFPLREMLGPIELSAVLAGVEQAELIEERVAGALGLAAAPASVEETAWAARKLFEALARERQLLLVFEDVHWAEPTLRDLIEHEGEVEEAAPGAEVGQVADPLLVRRGRREVALQQDWERPCSARAAAAGRAHATGGEDFRAVLVTSEELEALRTETMRLRRS
jgi:hypothetical protein